MPRKATEKTAAAIKHDKLKAELKTAKKKLALQDNDANKKAVEKLAKELADITPNVNRERFLRVANPRIKKALSGIRGLQNVANPRAYSFTQADVDKAMELIQTEIAALKTRFATALAGGAKRSDAPKAADIFE